MGCCRADSSNGYISKFVVYTGKSDDGPTTNLGHKVVMEVCKDILEKGYHIHCNNFFTSVQLAADLLEHGTHIIGTIHHNRIDFPKDIVNKDAMAGCTRSMSVSTIIDKINHKLFCLVRP